MRCLLLSLCLATAWSVQGFEKIALVDSFDYHAVFDTETATGNVQILDHVLLTGADTILWRNQSGAVPRYQSKVEDVTSLVTPLDKRRIPSSRDIAGWMHYHDVQPDIVRMIGTVCKSRGLVFGIHMPYEENHYASWTFGAWNLEHPEWACRRGKGVPWAGCGSLAFPEVVEHKLRLVGELLDRGAQVVLVDLKRDGGWSPALERVTPVIEAWRAKYGDAPLPAASDERWLTLVSGYQHAYFKAVKTRMGQEGRPVRLILGIDQVSDSGKDRTWLTHALDWRRLVKEKVVDGLAVLSIKPDPADPWNSTRRIYKSVIDAVAGGCPVYFPIMSYNFPNRPGYPEYMKWTKLSDGAVVQKLLEIAADVGGAGIEMEVVDYRNYSPAVCKAIREFQPRPKRPSDAPKGK